MSKVAFRSGRYPYGKDYWYFCTEVAKLTGIDLHSYKSNQMHRRLVNYMERHGISSFKSFVLLLKKDPEERGSLVEYLTINVSDFFRNKEQWRTLAEHVVPMLTKSVHSKLKVWSAGASTGQETYSIAIILIESSLFNVSILGTDIHEPSLSKAFEGRYTPEQVKNVPREFLARYFRTEKGSYVIKDALKQIISFRIHNLLSPRYPTGMDLILCRNVLIYFTEQGKQNVVLRLASSLKPGGVLFMGATEALFNPDEYGLEQVFPFFYRRPS